VTASSEQSAAIYVGIGKALFLINRGAAYELQLAHTEDAPSYALSNIEETLTKLYARLLDFLASALLVQDGNSLRRAFNALCTPQDILSFSEDCLELERTLEVESRLIESRCNQKVAENVMKLLNAASSLENIATDTKGLLDALRLEQLEERRLQQEKQDNVEALSWVSSLPILDHHIDAKNDRAPGTGQWVFKKPEFSGWQTSPGACFLWIHGIREFIID
jgi:hypothetical protein